MAAKIGALIRKARRDKGIGQKDLAKMLEKTASTLSQVETGQLIPGEQLLKSICQVLDIDYELAGRLAHLEKARTEFQRLAALESLKRYELDHARANKAGTTLRSKFHPGPENSSIPAGAPNSLWEEKARNSPANFIIVPTVDAETLTDTMKQEALAFSRKWLDDQGGENYKKLIVAPNQEMAPLIDKGDLVLIDASPNGRQIKTGQIYALHDGRHFLLRRIYYGSTPHLIILAADNKREYPDQEVNLHYEAGNPVIFGRVFWLARNLG